jgi:phage repressor protein C with HTH and peptisase S24 domain
MEIFGGSLGVSSAAVHNWESGKTPISLMVAQSMENCYGISREWLLGGKGSMFIKKLNERVVPGTQTIVPILSAQADAGTGNALEDYVSETGGLSFSDAWLREAFGISPENLCLLRVTGDSMKPTIDPDQMVFVDGLHKTPEYCDGVWVLRTRGLLFVKRVHRLAPDDYEITSDNPAYGSLEPDESTRLLGRVVGLPKRF